MDFAEQDVIYFDVGEGLLDEDVVILDFQAESALDLKSECPLVMEHLVTRNSEDELPPIEVESNVDDVTYNVSALTCTQDWPQSHVSIPTPKKEKKHGTKHTKTVAAKKKKKLATKEIKKLIDDDDETKTDYRSNECKVCHSFFTDVDKLRRHQQTHISYKCCQCHELFASMASLTKHATVHDDGTVMWRGKRHLCSTCGKTFSKPHLLRDHAEIHGDRSTVDFVLSDTLYMCEYCPYTHKKRSELNRHQKIHTRQETFECDLCKKTFIRRHSLRVHMEYHMKERKYCCKFCGKFYLTKCNLNGHMKIHGRSLCDPSHRPHECVICHKSFYRQVHLTNHMLTHTGEEEKVCEECEPRKTFGSLRAFKVHIKKFHA